MTKIFVIAIVMWWADPTTTPANDSVEITHLHGQPLYFKTIKDCGVHIDNNLQALKEYGKFVYPTAHTVKTIYCVERTKAVNNNEI
tara:strand:+ start:103 stop:360 length:258 start_codon:yes stop_codon:yes gene_type:complete